MRRTLPTSVLLALLATGAVRADHWAAAKWADGPPPAKVLSGMSLTETRVATIEPCCGFDEVELVDGERNGERVLFVVCRSHGETSVQGPLSADPRRAGPDVTLQISEMPPLFVDLHLRHVAGEQVRYRWSDGPRSPGRVRLGARLPGFVAKDLSHGKVRAEDLVGKVLVIDWWSVFCLPCQEEIPRLNEWAAQFADEPRVALLAIAPDPAWNVRRTVRSRPFDFRKLVLSDGEEVFGGVFPRSLVVDLSGVVRYDAVGYGPGSLEKWQAAVREALAEARESPTRDPGELP